MVGENDRQERILWALLNGELVERLQQRAFHGIQGRQISNSR